MACIYTPDSSVYCSVCDDTPPKENTMTAFTVSKNTTDAKDRVKRRAERTLKNIKDGSSAYNTRVEVTAHIYDAKPYATLYVQVPSEGESDGQYVSVSLDAADLEKLETAVFNARKKVAEASKPPVLRVSELLAAKF